ncbi:hypothetical protein ACNQFN_05620 [Thauera butanivorans]|uniref:hypothetical protein n=1 Tax=Thauera butanivorans TaxID=86174 RepID=UPI003AB5AC59
MNGSLASPDAEHGRSALAPKERSRARRTLLLLALVCVLPVLASYLMFYVWQPEGRVNNGTLLEPVPLPDSRLQGVDGQPALGRADLQGRWTLLLAAPSICDSACARALYVSRQARLAQAREMERVTRVWLLTDDGKPAEGQLPGSSLADALHVVRADAGWLAALPPPASGSLTGTIYLVDPLGKVMMRFDDRLDVTEAARALTKDLQRLLKYSALGRGERL